MSVKPDYPVLLVDDEPFMRRLVYRMLQSIGVEEISEAADGDEAIRLLMQAEKEFGAVLLDLQMPHLDGLSTLRFIRAAADTKFKKVPVIVLTRQSDATSVAEATALGIHDFLLKPLSQVKLQAALQRVSDDTPVDPGQVRAGVSGEAPVKPAADASDYSYMIVDDDAFMLKMIGRIVTQLGARQITVCHSAEEALRSLTERAPDILISDLKMPEMDGVAFMRHLAQRRFAGGLILLSGESRQVLDTVEALARAHRLAVLGTLQKPLQPPKLAELIENWEQQVAPAAVPNQPPLSVEALKQALISDQIDVFLQPKVALKTKQIAGFEALARWCHPTHGLISPGQFIDLAEENGLIDGLTRAIVKKALIYARKLHPAGISANIAINFSVDTLAHLDLPDTLLSACKAHSVAPETLTVEVTESRVMQDTAAVLEVLTRLRLMGFGLSIDDFGTGYSSMEKLKTVPFTELKVDRAFVHGATRSASSRAILETAVSLAGKLGLSVVAEGVERPEDWALVAELGADYVQGYYVSKPLPAEKVARWAAQWLNKSPGT